MKTIVLLFIWFFVIVKLNKAEKINYLKNFLKYKSVFLPPVYNEWKKEKQKREE